MRFAEDQNIEEYGSLKKFLETKEKVYPKLDEFFKKADSKYNSSLFKPEEYISKLKIEDKTLHSIIRGLYYPKCPYEFSVLPIEILGSIYEKFLGKTIRLTTSHQAKVEEKPEVRKAGGVYYTPQYIVDYIVENTVGEKLKEKVPKDIEGLTILDPACGSGSFLVRAYDYLLKWYLEKYTKKQSLNKNIKDGKIYKVTDGNYRLSILSKQEILKCHIYGVDIDRQAVEVTKLSLLLKLMEGESDQTAAGFLRFDQVQLLPDLSTNIKCGNSLIGSDFYKGKNLSLFGTEEKMKINVFDWESPEGFEEIMKAGGFDCVIGNPPWGAEFNAEVKKYLVMVYPEVPSKIKDSYLYFVLCAISKFTMLNGQFSFIIPNTWLLINHASKFRKYILKYEVINISDYGDGVFEGVTAESSVLVLRKNLKTKQICNVRRWRKGHLIIEKNISKSIWLKNEPYRIILEQDDRKSRIIEKLKKTSETFSDSCEIIWGIKPYQVGHGKPPQTKADLRKRIYHSSEKIDSGWKPLLVGSNIDRYSITFQKKPLEYIKYGEWLMYPSNESKILNPKILLRQTSTNLKAVFDDNQYYCQNSVFIITSKIYNLKFLLALFNSKLLDFLYRLQNPQIGKVFPEIKPSVIKSLLIRKHSNIVKSQHDLMVSLVDQMLATQKKLHETISPIEKKHYQKEADILDKQIDTLVYELYELTPEEIKIVEGEGYK